VRISPGRVAEIQIDQQGNTGAWIACPPAAVPAAGQYLLARAPVEDEAVLAVPLFLAGLSEGGFLAAPPVPGTWNPGTSLELRGILGNGFRLPKSLRRLALAAFGETPARLLPLAQAGLEQDLDVALFTDSTVPLLPSSLEIQPASALPEALTWADFLALDLPVELLPRLRSLLGVNAAALPCPAQALVLAPMPCGALAECGVCAVPARRGWKLACKDGPVLDLRELEW
jgi:dihydroorotate dehydrogenase electron transfer subunit